MGKLLTKCVSSGERASENNNSEKPQLNGAKKNKVAQTKTNISDASPKPTMADRAVPKRQIEYYYKMDHKKRGIALIFNHEKFYDFDVTTRIGTNIDRDRLHQTFSGLGFDVIIHNDRTEREIKTILQEVADMDHSDSDCLVVIMLSHGALIPFVDYTTGEESSTILSHDLMGYIYAKDRQYPLQTIWRYFTDENCPTLKNKPRIFIIQACQGDRTDEGFKLLAKRSLERRIETDGIPFQPIKLESSLPQNDFLIAYATLPGFFSFRNTERGAWFVQTLCKEIDERKSNYDLIKILTFVNQTVAYDYQSNANRSELNQKKQMPCVMSMLTKLLLFPKKEIVYYY
ncbi:caspase-1-like [Contarinia nasturtii]|uniref:caspase-1-like n=1 Tax=Contarinia nasturtii TaxID=265458 RepID=UPI0012D416D5|nr:caspase-1-like [Contarinia nasturtii]